MKIKTVAWLVFFLSWLLPLPLQAKPLEMELKAEGLYVSNPSTAVLQRMFDDYGYRDYIYMPDWKYPPLFLNAPSLRL